MSTLLLRIAAPLQSWGIESKYDTRGTMREPTKSGILGMIAAALGVPRDDEETLKSLNALRFGVRVDQEGIIINDLHIAKKSEKEKYLTHRYYLSDAIFLCGLESKNTDVLEEIEAALLSPEFPLFLGRRSCPPSLPMVMGVVPDEMEIALTNYKWLASEHVQKKKNDSTRLRIIVESYEKCSGSEYRKDVPISFNPQFRKYGYRIVCPPVLVPACKDYFDPCVTDHDAFKELEG